MQVRKYEATTIKEAVDMVKKDLGPDAIILSTKETQKHMGANSPSKVLITAAVAEDTLNRKRTVEQNLSQKDLTRLSQKSARVQRQFITKPIRPLTTKSPKSAVFSKSEIMLPSQKRILKKSASK